MQVKDICATTMCYSDNTAANLLFDLLGGPSALTTTLRRWEDSVTRLARLEPEHNDVSSTELRDTATPSAMLGLMAKTLVDATLSPTSRQQLCT